MCLLITQPAGTVFEEQFLDDVYGMNSDGVGVMYAEEGAVTVVKFLPATALEALEFYNEHISGRDCAVHYRMRTHGATDFTNCHPYEVISAEEGTEMWLMHNGILHTGNDTDVSKSDTWHYVQDFLRPMLLSNPGFMLTEAFKTIVGEHIGNGNKFTLLDAHGNMVTVNDDQGVDYNGAWLSNTYAWKSVGKPYKSRRFVPSYAGGYGSYGTYGSTLGSKPATLNHGYSRFGAFDYDDGDEYDFETVKPGTVSPLAMADKQYANEYTAEYEAEEYKEEWVGLLFDYIDESYIVSEGDRFGYDMARAYYATVGVDAAWEFLDMLEDYSVDADTMYDVLTRKLLSTELILA